MTKIISITGDLGSGKSTVSDLLIKQLGYEYVYTGKIQREIARRYNMTTLELNQFSETNSKIDDEVDATFKSLSGSSNLLVDSRLAWFFLPKSFKVFLKTNLIVSVNRISNDGKRESERYASKEDAAHKIMARKLSENKRYLEYYGANCAELSHFNLIIDTSFITPERVAEIIIAEYQLWLTSQMCTKAFISPINLYPTKSIHVFESERFKNIQNNRKENGCNWDDPVMAINMDSFDYIFDGHKRTSCAIKSNINLIPVVYQDGNSCSSKGLTYKTELLNLLTPNLFYEWEDFHSFKYLLYPSIVTKTHNNSIL
jgi:cytidylate kinase